MFIILGALLYQFVFYSIVAVASFETTMLLVAHICIISVL